MKLKNREIKLIIVDLDDTIWTWFDMWYKSFSTLLCNISTKLSINEAVLREAFKKIHQKYHSSESSFILDDLGSILTPSQIDIIKSEEIVSDEKSILHQFYSLRKHSLKLYDGVNEFFNFVENEGIKVVGYTESNSFFTKQRLKHKNLDGKLYKIYAPRDFSLPDTVVKKYKDGYWEPKYTIFEELPQKDKKPNPETLMDIIKKEDVTIESVVYIGDKLSRDIIMANEAGVLSAYAKYGDSVDRKEYDLLRSVSHWSEYDIKRESEIQKLVENKIAKPDFILEKSIDEIFK